MGRSPEIILLRQNESKAKHKTPNHQTKTITKCTYNQDYTWKVFKLYLGPEAHNYWERRKQGVGTWDTSFCYSPVGHHSQKVGIVQVVCTDRRIAKQNVDYHYSGVFSLRKEMNSGTCCRTLSEISQTKKAKSCDQFTEAEIALRGSEQKTGSCCLMGIVSALQREDS